SRRRHTRFSRDWSSDVCSSDLQSGEFVWNSGIFVWKNESIIRAFEQLMPELAEVFEEGKDYLGTEEEPAFIQRAYTLVKNISIRSEERRVGKECRTRWTSEHDR